MRRPGKCPKRETAPRARAERGLACPVMVGRSFTKLTRGSRGGNQLARRASVQDPCPSGSYDERSVAASMVIQSKEIGRRCHE
jgi:hypothetical protein